MSSSAWASLLTLSQIAILKRGGILHRVADLGTPQAQLRVEIPSIEAVLVIVHDSLRVVFRQGDRFRARLGSKLNNQ